MSRAVIFGICCLILLSAGCPVPEKPKKSAILAGDISSAIIDGPSIDPNLTGPRPQSRLVIDQLEDLKKLPPDLAAALEKLVKGTGIVSMASLDYYSKSNDMEFVTLKIFVFDNEKSARAWCEKMLTNLESEDYEKLSDWPRLVMRSRKMNKRIACVGTVLMTTFSLDPIDSTQKVMDKYLERI